MHDCAAGEVKSWQRAAQARIEDAALAPNHVGHRRIDHDRPEDEEDSHGAELHPLSKCSGDESGGDDGEHELVDHESLHRDGRAVVRVRSQANAAHEGMMQTSDEARAGIEG